MPSALPAISDAAIDYITNPTGLQGFGAAKTSIVLDIFRAEDIDPGAEPDAVPKLLAALKERKNGGKKYRFFVEGYDKLKLFGTVILMILYVLALDLVGFLPASILFVLLFNVLFCGTLEKNSLLVSAVIAVVFPVAVWLIFGKLFNVTLP